MHKSKHFSNIKTIHEIKAIILSAKVRDFCVVVDLKDKLIGIISINTPIGHFSGLGGAQFFKHHAKYYPPLVKFTEEIYELVKRESTI